MLLKYINIPVFILSFAIGMFFVYIVVPETRSIIVYPTPENVSLLQYRDATGGCFQIRETAVDCPADAKEISKVPPQS
jgi:hypothetical protein